jgi:hypothetical protein
MLAEYPAFRPDAGHVRPVMEPVRLSAGIASATLVAVAVDSAVARVVV